MYKDMSYDELVDGLHALAAVAPEYVRVFSGNEAMRVVPAAGTCGTRHRACETWVVVVTHFASLPPEQRGAGLVESEGALEIQSSAAFQASRAELFLSGALHGDERVGPAATLAAVRLLALGALCADDPMRCSLLTEGEALPSKRMGKWLRLLARRRVVYATPATNAVGFAHMTRSENTVDPNRDFPIDTTSVSCMRSHTARVVNELFRRHIFQIAVTFHGGMRAIAFEWGAPTYDERRMHLQHRGSGFVHHKRPGGRRLLGSLKAINESPDENSQRDISILLSKAAGSFGKVPAYAVDRMNTIVYPVHGGMEDWAYAGSWDPNLRVHEGCTAEGYSASRTSAYSNASLRAFAILVETSDDKRGPPSEFGFEEAVFNPMSSSNGHVARNARLALAAIDVVEPYVQWLSTQGPLFEWVVGGAVTVDSTYLKVSCADSESFNLYAEPIPALQAPWGLPTRPAPAFRASLEDPRRENCRLTAFATVDRSWQSAPHQAHPRGVPPQTHVANVRTNPDWRHAHNGRLVTGKNEWASSTILYRPTRRLHELESPPSYGPAGLALLSAAAALAHRFHVYFFRPPRKSTLSVPLNISRRSPARDGKQERQAVHTDI